MVYKILSLDGGGTWALLQAMALKAMFGDVPGKRILAQFDMAVANSGGSIVLAGLIADFTPDEILDLFLKKRETIFVKNGFFQRIDALFQGERYSTAKKLVGLTAALQPIADIRLKDLAGRLPKGPSGETVAALIVGFDYDKQRAEFFRTFTTGMNSPPSRMRLVDAVHASTNAPVLYFDKPTVCRAGPDPTDPERRYWDGAIGGYNNPVMAGIVEALSLGKTPASLKVLSIGTGNSRRAPPETAPAGTPRELIEPHAKPGFFPDLKKLASSINAEPPDAASYSAYFVMGHKPPMTAAGAPAVAHSGRLIRLNPMIQPTWNASAWRWETFAGLSDEDFGFMAGLDMDVTDDNSVGWVKWLGDRWIEGDAPNQPIRASSTLECILGDATFAAAKARW